MRTVALAFLLLLLLSAWPRAPVLARDDMLDDAKKKLAANAKDPFEQDQRERALRDLAKIGGKAAAEAVVPVFRDPFEHLADHAVSAWIAMLEGERADETRAWLAGKALKHRDAAVRRGAASALALDPGDGAPDEVGVRLHKEKDPEVLTALLRTWARHRRTQDGAPWKLLAHKDGRVVLAVAEAIVATGTTQTVPPGAREDLLEARDPLARAGAVLYLAAADMLTPADVDMVLGDAAVEPRIALAETLREPPADTLALERLGWLLDDDAWRVRAAAIRTAEALWQREVIPLLIDRLERERGRLKLDVVELLQAMTGKSLAWDADLWRSWWGAQGADFELPDRPGDGRGGRRAPAADPDGESQTAAFFQLPVVSQRIAFVLDCSGSMRNPALGEKVGGISKMEVARRELEQTLKALSPDVVFDVFLYRYPSDYPPKPVMSRAFGKLQRCTPKNASSALRWLGKQEGKGWGAFYDALKLVLAEDVDTIYFLSDGRPSRGRYDRDFRLIREIQPDNRFRQAAIHTVLVGSSGADRKFMERLAGVTGGRFVDAVPQMEEAARDAGKDG